MYLEQYSNKAKSREQKVAWEEENDFFRSIGYVLLNQWDPLGISENEYSDNKYNRYIPIVYKWAIKSNDKEYLINCLSNLAKSELGVETNFHNDKRAAEIIIAVRDFHFKNPK